MDVAQAVGYRHVPEKAIGSGVANHGFRVHWVGRNHGVSVVGIDG